MAWLLAVDWDQCEARYVLATTRGQQLSVAAVASTPLAPPDDSAPEPGPGPWLREELDRHKRGRAEALIGLDRASIELLHLSLPPARDDELPELVRNQAMRESALVTDDSLLDFVALPGDAGERKVTAMALSHEALEKIEATCAAAGVTPTRMLVRPYAATSLLTRLVDPADGVCLLISRYAEEVDLTVVDQHNVVFWRTVQLPSSTGPDAATDALLAEVRRTLMVVQNQTGGDPIRRIYVLGDAPTHQDLIRKIGDQLSFPAELVAPFDALPQFQGEVPADAGRYAALLGMLLDEAEGRAPAVDFLHPRRKPAPPNRRRIITIAAALVAAVVLAAFYGVWSQFSSLDAQRLQLVGRSRQLEQLVKKAAKQQGIVEAIRDWKSSDVVLLDELRDLSLRLPQARDMVVRRFSKSPSRSGWCVINLQGLVRDPRIVSRMERNLRDQFHEVRTPRRQELRQEEGYTWRFDSSITVVARDKDQYAHHLPEQKFRGPGERLVRPESTAVRARPTTTPSPPN